MTNTVDQTGSKGLVEEATSQIGDAAAVAQDKAVELKDEGRSKLSESLDQRTNEVGEQARKMAQALRQSGGQLREHGEDSQAAAVAEGAADRIERLGGYLAKTSGDALLRDVEDFARRQPWMLAGIGLAAGIAASRFLRASSERRYVPPTPGSSQRSTEFAPSSAGRPLARESYGRSG
jgi:ElaB/YqjD/DUF883 family membrane-anchored ribosome-binding protein